ncbi:unnamed protein product [Acanthoscelides obtectus]|uniref:Uncharacterized protein n=1 Tax=Acanthoscelides obtectus TaxID=200917 RepID=A0A9P0JTI0_ACAOB|nr:unnamed protein product [Acanthoscelides obtectus]CAK1640691.1 Protein takeout [Acanthoscelides obtectus]
MYKLLCFLCVACFIDCALALRPSYIKACKVNSPDFDECALQNGRGALPYIVKGDRKYNIPKLNPLKLPVVNVDAGKDLNIKLTNIAAKGLEKVELDRVKIDTVKREVYLDMHMPRVELIGQYDINGKILILPIQGKGPCNITGVEPKFQYHFKYVLDKVNDEEYMKLTDDDNLDFQLKRAYFNLENLFDGNKQLGDNMNQFLNENWQEVVKEIGGAISQTIRAVARAISSGYFKKVPYRELLIFD